MHVNPLQSLRQLPDEPPINDAILDLDSYGIICSEGQVVSFTINNQKKVGTIVISHQDNLIIEVVDEFFICLLKEYSKIKKIEQALESKIEISHKLQEIGLYAQEYEKVTIVIENTFSIPALKMPHFITMSLQGKQMCDKYMRSPPFATSLLFGTVDNLKSPEHWGKILRTMDKEVALYLLNNFCFDYAAFNLIIINSQETEKLRIQTSSSIFSELGQDIHLHFSGFNRYHMMNEQWKNYGFTDIKGEILESNISNYVRLMQYRIREIVLKCVSSREYRVLSGKEDWCGRLIELTEYSEAAFAIAWKEVGERAVAYIKQYLQQEPIHVRGTCSVTDTMLKKALQHGEEPQTAHEEIRNPPGLQLRRRLQKPEEQEVNQESEEASEHTRLLPKEHKQLSSDMYYILY